MKWINAQCLANGLELIIENQRSIVGEVVYDLRFLAMGQKMFVKHVVNSGLLTSGEIKAIQDKMNAIDIPDIQWQLGVRKQSYEMLVFKRFDRWKAEGWEYNGEPDCVLFG